MLTINTVTVIRISNNGLTWSPCLHQVLSISGAAVMAAVRRKAAGHLFLPFAPLTPVFRGEMKTFGVYAQVTLLHCSLMTLDNVL